MSDKERDVTSTAVIRCRFDLIVAEKDGLVTVADKAGNDLLTLTLAAAEEVAFKIQFAAEHGRLLARDSGSNGDQR